LLERSESKAHSSERAGPSEPITGFQRAGQGSRRRQEAESSDQPRNAAAAEVRWRIGPSGAPPLRWLQCPWWPCSRRPELAKHGTMRCACLGLPFGWWSLQFVGCLV